ITVCLRLPGGSCMAPLTVTLMVLSPRLALAGDTRPKCTLWVLSYYKVGKFQAVTELGRPVAENWNSQKVILEEKRDKVDSYCRYNYGVFEIQPKVTVYPAKTQPLQHHNLLVCSTEVRWFWNGKQEKAGVVSTGLIQNGDWTFQTLVMLETVPRSGEVYTCQVENSSVTSPLTVQWRARSESAQSKMLRGTGSFVLGLLFLGAGLFVYFRNQKGNTF
uniref:Ig-like domain-containing protein n=1 Tax=Rhinopithecus roxellana TaxID=61622 RepID=A0A2K6RGN4_RHIRO